MRIVICGPGALGCLLAARISTALQTGDELTLLDHHHDRARQMNSNGFFLEEDGEDHHFTVPATADPTGISSCDLFFLCTRSVDTARAIRQAASLLTPATLLISFQRGISHLQDIENSPAPAAAAVTSADVFLKSPGRFSCLDPGLTRINLLDDAQSDAQLLDQVVLLLNRSGLETEKTENIRQLTRDCFFVDLAVNALAAIYRRPNGQLLTSCSVRSNMKKVLNEATAVAKAKNFGGSDDPIKTTFQFLRTEKHRIAPMLRDVNNQRPTEIDALNGTIAKMGKQLTIPTPVNDDFVMRIKKIEADYL